MTMFDTEKINTEANRIVALIDSAPVEGWLKERAREELVSLLHTVREAIEVQNEEKEVDASMPNDPFEYSDGDFRRQAAALATYNGHFNVADAQAIHKFLKGE